MQLQYPTYLKQTYLFELQTKIIDKKGNFYQFADTIFHPQGGGQPNDKGQIIYHKHQLIKTTPILSAVSDRESGKITYQIQTEDQLNIGDVVTMKIDKELRIRNAKLHSAGHMLDLATQRMKLPWQAGKGHHFQDSPYVQYKGVIQNNEQVLNDINKQMANIISQKIQTKKQVYSYQQAVQKKLISEAFKTPIVRIVSFDTAECPCGGTHIQNTDQIKQLKVTKIQKKGKNVRLYYKVE